MELWRLFLFVKNVATNIDDSKYHRCESEQFLMCNHRIPPSQRERKTTKRLPSYVKKEVNRRIVYENVKVRRDSLRSHSTIYTTYCQLLYTEYFAR